MTGEGCLLIDNSNTRTKLMLCRPGAEVEVRILPTAEISHESLSRVLSGWSFERVCLCSVVPWAAKVIADCVGDVEFHQMNVESATGVDFSTYPGRATLGADRVANVLAAVQRVPLPLVAVDLGTAATFDVVVQGEHGPVFSGGIIAPGLSAVAGSLANATAMLPAVEMNADGPIIGRTTQEAMSAAVRVGYPGMVDALLSGIESELGRPVHVVLTGGDAASLAPSLHHQSVIVPLLTFEGIALVAGVNI